MSLPECLNPATTYPRGDQGGLIYESECHVKVGWALLLFFYIQAALLLFIYMCLQGVFTCVTKVKSKRSYSFS